MKLTVRIFAFCLVLAGAAAASFSSASSSNTRVMAASHMSATAGLPIPLCGPGIPCGGGHGR